MKNYQTPKEIEEMAKDIESMDFSYISAEAKARALYYAGYRKVIDRNTAKVLNYEIESLKVEDYKKEIEKQREMISELFNDRKNLVELLDYSTLYQSYKNLKEEKDKEISKLKSIIAMTEEHFGLSLPFENEFDNAIKEAKKQGIKEFIESLIVYAREVTGWALSVSDINIVAESFGLNIK